MVRRRIPRKNAASAVFIHGDACHIPLADETVDCVITSPPYFNLRNYNAEGQIGLENYPEEYVEKIVEVFREVKRVLKTSGTLFLVLGDSYAGSGKGQMGDGTASDRRGAKQGTSVGTLSGGLHTELPASLKQKDLIGIPWMCAFALRADKWWLRDEIIWSKNNPMPASVKDRTTTSHEHVFLLTKCAQYYYDWFAVLEPAVGQQSHIANSFARKVNEEPPPGQPDQHRSDREDVEYSGTRNRRSVWTINTQSCKYAHFAVFPEKLATLCMLAGAPEKVCSVCGKPWERIIEKGLTAHDGDTQSLYPKGTTANRMSLLRQAARERGEEYVNQSRCVGWKPTCTCNADPVRSIIFDPFAGSGTCGKVARNLGHKFVGMDLNFTYLHDICPKRMQEPKKKQV